MQAENSTSGNFFSRLTESLEFAGRKPADLDAAGVALSTYYRWREGSVPQDRTAQAVAAYLGVDADWLLRGRGDMVPFANGGRAVAAESEGAGAPAAVSLREPSGSMRQEDMRALLEDIVGWAEADAIRGHLQDIVRRMDAGDLSLAGAFSVLIETIRRVRPGILTPPAAVSYSESKLKRTSDP